MSAPIAVAFYHDAADSLIANTIRDLAFSGHAVIDVTLLSDDSDVLRLVFR